VGEWSPAAADSPAARFPDQERAAGQQAKDSREFGTNADDERDLPQHLVVG
jgi:hypothetical protein